MAQVQLNTPAADFTLEDFNGKAVQLSAFRGKKHVVLVLNRGFI
jgi:peroxiredoxin